MKALMFTGVSIKPIKPIAGCSAIGHPLGILNPDSPVKYRIYNILKPLRTFSTFGATNLNYN